MLWMPPPTAMETFMGVFNEDTMVHPKRAHVFVVPRLMIHLWRKHLGKDADVLTTIITRNHFWERSQHGPLILAIVLPFAYVKTYRGPWVAHGLEKSESLRKELEAGFKIDEGRNPTKFPHMGRMLCGMRKNTEGRSRNILLKTLDWVGGFPPIWHQNSSIRTAR